ncbi:uncharacterized protein TNCV_5004411 [Trichonephila clavipes]|uniref:Uncharacterized protein n=1 Tax=Trichonephila clavipes TaxID=2585209 RepID=A0A8X6RMM1_TRICX|nr:uncharacterized protein TNCV_5004411 [Trichonephila clavipes]
MTAWVLRFCHNLKGNSHQLRKELTFQEIQMAEEAVVRIIQTEWSSELQEIVRLRVANGDIIRPIQRIYPLEIDSAEFNKSVPENVESATETIDDVDHEHIPPEEQSETLRIEQSQSVKKTRFGRPIVPVKRLDLLSEIMTLISVCI